MKRQPILMATLLGALLLSACGGRPKYDIYDWTPSYGSGRNNESYLTYDASYDEDDFKIEPVAALQDGKRDDFMMGVDASMVHQILESGGKYYNQDGVEQDVFQIMALAGVNYLRVRVWNDPTSPIGINGGGDLDLETAFWIAQRARMVNMKIIIDLHYSDTWADPENQEKPYAWELLTFDELKTAVHDYTYEAVKYFKDRGITPYMIQIGNEINNGMIYPDGKLVWNDATSYDKLADLLKAGIAGAKEADEWIDTIIHLADGGKWPIFDSFFTNMESRGVEYDVIGASFYPFYHGTMASLKTNLENIAEKFDKPVFVAEASYGYTHLSHNYAANIFGPNQEENGGYLATIQGQATSIRDIIDVVANVPDNMGLGIIYWEPAWLPVPGAGWAENGTMATWSNQALFTYGGRALPSINVFNAVRADAEVNVALVGLKSDTIEVNLNIASQVETESEMPTQVIALNNLDAYIYADVDWDDAEETYAESHVGNHVVSGVVTYGANQWNIVANVRSIQNYIVNSGFESGKTGANDEPVKAPWVMESTTASNVGKVQTNKDFRTGTNNFNFYHTGAFNFRLYQDLSLPNGTYDLSVYAMGESNSKITELYLYIENYGGAKLTQNITVSGWSSGYARFEINGIAVTNGTIVRIGIYGSFPVETWGHLDDFELTAAG
ncbi:MAG: glycosyl hydrolase 53 family protein [Bacilli bacterium]|jgi:arabinogalactan endo-1,4-beta-galactosidase